MFLAEGVVSVKRSWMLGGDDDNLRLLALQAQQISGTIDPRTPIRALLGTEPPRAPQPRAKAGRIAVAAKLKDSDFARLINERLAPAGLN